MSRSNDHYKYDHPRSRYPKWLRFSERSIGKANKRLFFKRKAKACLKQDMRRDPDEITLTPWNKMTHYPWWW